jgi:1-acyl-sn-glycerol-3-phosphate acyltransferase
LTAGRRRVVYFRSILFNAAYYLVSTAMVILSLPVFAFGNEKAGAWVIRTWARMGTFFLRVFAGTRLEIRGLENLPAGGAIIAAKHQSMFETFALFPRLPKPTYVMKHELAKIPLWGWYATRAGMITVERDQGTAALRRLATDVSAAVTAGRQVIIFPEGTRRPPGAPADYKGGIAHLYRMTGAPVVPAALNSGLFWPRRRMLRFPGTIVIEFLPPIPPGLTSRAFLERLETEVETASTRLLAEAAAAKSPPPLPPEAAERLANPV